MTAGVESFGHRSSVESANPYHSQSIGLLVVSSHASHHCAIRGEYAAPPHAHHNTPGWFASHRADWFIVLIGGDISLVNTCEFFVQLRKLIARITLVDMNLAALVNALDNAQLWRRGSLLLGECFFARLFDFCNSFFCLSFL